jgi:uncharacterized protein (TIGR02118 family)
MVRFLVLYGRPDDTEAFDRHYRDVHIPLARQLPGLRRYTVSRGVTVMTGEDPSYLIAELDFADEDALKEHWGRPPAGRPGGTWPPTWPRAAYATWCSSSTRPSRPFRRVSSP